MSLDQAEAAMGQGADIVREKCVPWLLSPAAQAGCVPAAARNAVSSLAAAYVLAVGVSTGGGTLLASHLRALRLPQSSRILAECMKVAVDRDAPEEPWSYDQVELDELTRMLEHVARNSVAGVSQPPLPLNSRERGEVEARSGLA